MVTTEVAVPVSLPVLAAQLAQPVHEVLASRAAALRELLPPRPDTAAGRYRWWRSLDEEQARLAAVLDRLEVLCQHLQGTPGLGYACDDPLPLEAVEAADGFTDEPLAEALALYRRLRADGRSGQGSTSCAQVSWTVSRTGRRP